MGICSVELLLAVEFAPVFQFSFWRSLPQAKPAAVETSPSDIGKGLVDVHWNKFQANRQKIGELKRAQAN